MSLGKGRIGAAGTAPTKAFAGTVDLSVALDAPVDVADVSRMNGGGKPVDLTFGEAMTRLETVVGQLEENKSLGLEQALALYEQGVALAEDCRQRLSVARLRLTEIAPSASSSAGETEPAL